MGILKSSHIQSKLKPAPTLILSPILTTLLRKDSTLTFSEVLWSGHMISPAACFSEEGRSLTMAAM